MRSRPPGLSDAVVAVGVSDGWRLPSTTAVYRAVGYGSHHWSVDDAAGGRWFASVDVLAEGDPGASFDRLAAALAVAVTAGDAGLSFVVAPVRMPHGAVLRRLPGGYALALYPYVAGRSGSFHDALTAAEADELVDMLYSLHAMDHAAAGADGGVGVETFAVPGRDRLEAALADLGDTEGWPGPYGERLRPLLAGHADDVNRVLREHDRLVTAAGPQTDRLVLTHGEPHPGNLIRTPGGLVLIDWDTALLAPPERDVWLLNARTGGQASNEYAARSGRPLNPELLTRYQLAWSLADLAVFVDLLRYTPDKTADTTWSWDALQTTLADLATLPGGLRVTGRHTNRAEMGPPIPVLPTSCHRQSRADSGRRGRWLRNPLAAWRRRPVGSPTLRQTGVMEVFESHGRRFELTLASDVINDGMGLELADLSEADCAGPVLEAFWHDDGSGFDFISHRASKLPFDVVERFVFEARRRLPPVS